VIGEDECYVSPQQEEWGVCRHERWFDYQAQIIYIDTITIDRNRQYDHSYVEGVDVETTGQGTSNTSVANSDQELGQQQVFLLQAPRIG